MYYNSSITLQKLPQAFMWGIIHNVVCGYWRITHKVHSVECVIFDNCTMHHESLHIPYIRTYFIIIIYCGGQYALLVENLGQPWNNFNFLVNVILLLNNK